VHSVAAFDIEYRGFLITREGTIVVKGFGDLKQLRQPLRTALPFASKRQPEIGHVSLGRILDPVGEDTFSLLQKLVKDSEGENYGTLHVSEVKYIHETKWYMEEKDLIKVLSLRK